MSIPFIPYMLFSRIFLGALFWWGVMLFVFSGLLMWLWNITITRIFNIREITYWEAFRLMLIFGILLGKGFSINFNG